MQDFTLWIVTRDTKLLDAWSRLFTRESLRVEKCSSLEELARASDLGRGLALVSRNGDVEIDRERRTVRTGVSGKKPAELPNITPKEFEILAALLCKEEQVVTRNFLMENIWKEKSGRVNFETIDKHVETLRHKLGHYGRNVKTVYGSGYMYKADGKK